MANYLFVESAPEGQNITHLSGKPVNVEALAGEIAEVSPNTCYLAELQPPSDPANTGVDFSPVIQYKKWVGNKWQNV